MGQVYRGTDTTLGRHVAIKILPDAFASDSERLARFEREAKTLASLNHPHIAAIYGFEKSAGMHALVMELVEGEDLSQRIARSAIPIDEALPIAKQIAEALEAAHEQGIVHRDLKPANIKVRSDGTVKVLDFGLAKLIAPDTSRAGSMPGLSQSPTITSLAMMTGVGMFLGTAAYMSPEQARGKPVDRRADIWAFGCVLYEMLTGRRAFGGDEVTDVLARVLEREPDFTALPAKLPATIRMTLRRCLQKDSRQRLQHIGDARLDIADAQQVSPDAVIGESRRGMGRERIAWALLAVVAATAAGAAVRWGVAPAPDARETRLDITTPGTATLASFAISPDGRTVVFNGDGPRGPQLWVRPLDSTSARPLEGTEGGQYPFWSPAGRSVGFFANGKLKRTEIDGGQPQSLADVLTPAGGTWNADGTILYVPASRGNTFRVSETGGGSSELAPRRTPRLATMLPQFLPNGRQFLFFAVRADESGEVYVGDLENDDVRRVLSADTPASYGMGHLWFVRGRTLFAQRFDPLTLGLTGPVLPVADEVAVETISAAVSVSAAGPIAYRRGPSQLRRQLVWFDRAGTPSGSAGEGPALGNPSLARDDRRLLVQQTTGQNIDLWLFDLERSVPTRLTFDSEIDSMPVWSPDGRRMIFNRPRDREQSLTVRNVDGGAPDERVLIGDSVAIASDWSSDGQFVLYKQQDSKVGTFDLFALRVQGDRTPIRVAATPYDERDGQFSPDGTLIAFESNESGTPEIYLQPFPGPGQKTRISANGGTQVRWRGNGRELFYVAADNTLMSVPMGPGANRSGIGAPVPLFKTGLVPSSTISRQQYVVTSDGQRFLMITTENGPAPPITLLLNWQPAAQR